MRKVKRIFKRIINDKKLLIIIFSILLSLIVLLTTLVLILGKEEEKPKVKPKPVEVKEQVNIVDINSTSRPFAVMINNIDIARPLQSGLQDAYIMYEFIVEGGLTRYMALFLDQNTERIGSIRSSRHYFLDYALENDAIYCHHGQSPQALSDFGTLAIDRIEVSENRTGWRDKTLNVASEHTLFASIEKLNNGTENFRKERNRDLLLNYSANSLNLSKMKDSKKANNVSIKYSGSTTSSYEYDMENKVYKRSVNGKPHVDYVTKEQYTFKNIIAYDVLNSTIPGDKKDRQNLDNIGSGSGYYISEGYAVPIKWRKDTRDGQTKYYFKDGKELKVNDGNTFIQIYPKDGSITIN